MRACLFLRFIKETIDIFSHRLFCQSEVLHLCQCKTMKGFFLLSMQAYDRFFARRFVCSLYTCPKKLNNKYFHVCDIIRIVI